MGPEDLKKSLSKLGPVDDPNLLFGFDTSGDAGVYKLADGLAVVQSVDFFTPIVDDPYTFGQIAASNALSDLYTMGARPVTALNIIAFPCKLGTNPIAEILKGGADVVTEAGAVIVGGHSVEDDEPKYGMAVTGVADPADLITSDNAKPGDLLVLTKKIGVGILTSVAKLKSGLLSGLALRGPEISEDVYKEAVDGMVRLNKTASESMREFGVTACTDITGFGLLGHARNLAENSNVSLRINYNSVPKYEGIEAYAIAGAKGGGERNYNWMKSNLTVVDGVALAQTMIMCDPQTSGGLLMAVPEDKAEALVKQLHEKGDTASTVIGEVTEGPAGHIVLGL